MDDVRDKTFFAHVMSENCVIVSKSGLKGKTLCLGIDIL